MRSLRCFFSRGLFPAVFLLLAAGCATNRVDWNSLVGNYTYDQAVLDYGPPDKQAVLSDGTKVVEWLTDRGWEGGHSIVVPTGPYHTPSVIYHSDPPSPDYFLRLTFGPDGQLVSWKRIVK